MAEPEIDLLRIPRGSVTAPAGCGKTHLIADALFRHSSKKPILVLTHTNAGVAALRGRLDKARVPRSRYRLATLDGFAMRLISMFPKRSGHDPTIMQLARPKTDYPAMRDAALGLLAAGHLDDILRATYERLLIDEYQDCSLVQHAIAKCVAGALPTCVLGDPMQAIFDFNGLIDWEADVLPAFPSIGELTKPWRWINAGEPVFGQWLLDVRKALLAGTTIDLSTAPSNVRRIEFDGSNDHAQRLKACQAKAPTSDGCVLIIADATKPNEQRRFASQTPGAVTAENVDMRDLVSFANQFDLKAEGALKAVAHFAASVMTNVGADDLLKRVNSLIAGRARREATEAETAAIEFKRAPSYTAASALLAAINREAGVRAHRLPILRGCHRMFQLCEPKAGALTLYDAAVRVREQSRLVGRPLAKRTVGSTLLLKGLEADTSVILRPELMDGQHLYVAMTRGARSLVICSPTAVLVPLKR
jgi:hypothetical protein